MTRFLMMFEDPKFNWATIFVFSWLVIASLSMTEKDKHGANLGRYWQPEITVSGTVADRYMLENENRVIIIRQENGKYYKVEKLDEKPYYDHAIGDPIMSVPQREQLVPYTHTVVTIIALLASFVGCCWCYGLIRFGAHVAVAVGLSFVLPYWQLFVAAGCIAVWSVLAWNQMIRAQDSYVARLLIRGHSDHETHTLRLLGKLYDKQHWFDKVWIVNGILCFNEEDAVATKLKYQ